jgi:hypothetical protein
MDLFDTIKERLAQTSHDEVLKQMGYVSLRRGRETLERFLSLDSIQSWLRGGCFDMRHSAPSFLLALTDALELPEGEARKEIALHDAREERKRQMQTPYIFVDTGFKRRGQPIFILALTESLRRLIIDREALIDRSQEAIERMVTTTIRRHYEENDGRLAVWGEIKRYVYHDPEGNEICYGVDGTMLERACDVEENSASLRVGGQLIAGVEQ